MRYTVTVKGQIVAAVRNGDTTLEAICAAHNITEEEFRAWEARLDRAGQQALRVTRCQHYKALGL